MAVIQKIRNYSGLLIAVIGIGLAAFVLGDLLGPGPTGPRRFDVGEVEGTSITYRQFENRVQQQLENWQQQRGERPGPRDAFQVRQQVWEQMVEEILLEEEFERLGLRVSGEELYELITGEDPHPVLVQSFQDPATGRFDREQVMDFMANFEMFDPGTQRQWLMLEDFIRQDRKEEKYHNMIGSGYTVPGPMAAMDFSNRNATADIRYIYKSHDDIADDEVEITDRDLRRMYEAHKHRFEQQATRSIKYATLTVFPSAEDQEAVLNDILQRKERMKEVENLERFINAQSHERFDPTYYGRGELSPNIDPGIFDAEVGDVFGPYMEDNAYVVAMLKDMQMRPDSMRASHILVAYQGSASAGPETTLTREEAQQKADSILGVVRNNPAQFPILAAELSDDPSAEFNQGDLDWFPDGAMVPEFNEAVVEAPTGSFLTVETDFGFHVIHVTNKSPLREQVQVAKLVRRIEPSSNTFREANNRITSFAETLRETGDFDGAAEEADLNVREADRVGKMDFTLPGVQEGRSIVMWAFDPDTGVGDYSRIYEFDDKFVVATVTRKQDEGIPPLQQIRSQIEEIALREKKQEMIAEEMRGIMAEGGTLDDVAAQMNLEVMTANDITFNTPTLPNLGPEPKVIGAVFARSENETTRPIKGNNGVFVAEVTRMDDVITPDDLRQAAQPVRDAFRNRVRMQAFQAIKEKADITDDRAMFF